MFPWLTANRVAAIAGALIGIAAFITGNIGALPKGWENTALAIAGLLTTAAHLITYLIGAIHWQATPAGQAQYGPTPDVLPTIPVTTIVPPDQGDAGKP